MKMTKTTTRWENRPIFSQQGLRPSVTQQGRRSPSQLRPYQHIPFSPLQQVGQVSREKLSRMASHNMEKHFDIRHASYRSKENQHASCFKIRAKKSSPPKDNSNEAFWRDRLQGRMKSLQEINESYLREVLCQLQTRQEEGVQSVQRLSQSTKGRQQVSKGPISLMSSSPSSPSWSREQKIIGEYNIIYQYKECKLPIEFILL